MSDTLFLAESLEDLKSTFLTSVDPVHINRNSARGKVFVLILGSSCPSAGDGKWYIILHVTLD